MATFLMISKHTPDKCPAYNETTKRAYAKLLANMKARQTKYGVKLIGAWTAHLEHQSYTIFDAPSLEAYQAFSMDPDILAINAGETIEVKMVTNMEEVAKMLQVVT